MLSNGPNDSELTISTILSLIQENPYITKKNSLQELAYQPPPYKTT